MVEINQERPDLAVVQSEAKHVAQRLFQKVLRQNPPKEFFDVAVPIIATAILDGRADIVAQAASRIADLERRVQNLLERNNRQAEVIARGWRPTADQLSIDNDSLGG